MKNTPIFDKPHPFLPKKTICFCIHVFFKNNKLPFKQTHINLPKKKNNRFGETLLDKKTAFEKQNPFAERNNFVWKKQLWKKEPVQKKKTYPFSFFFF